MKMVAKENKKKYELTYLVSGGFTDSEVVKVKQEIAALIKKNDGTIVSEESMGKKPLAYTIKRDGHNYSEAHYVYVVFEVSSSKVQDLEHDVYLNAKIIRHLLVIANDEQAAPEVKSVEAKAE